LPILASIYSSQIISLASSQTSLAVLTLDVGSKRTYYKQTRSKYLILISDLGVNPQAAEGSSVQVKVWLCRMRFFDWPPKDVGIDKAELFLYSLFLISSCLSAQAHSFCILYTVFFWPRCLRLFAWVCEVNVKLQLMSLAEGCIVKGIVDVLLLE
jgi:hypothetical protein